jgi:hypothetical protein
MIFPFRDFFCRPGLAGNPPADTFKTAASTSALTLASGTSFGSSTLRVRHLLGMMMSWVSRSPVTEK